MKKLIYAFLLFSVLGVTSCKDKTYEEVKAQNLYWYETGCKNRNVHNYITVYYTKNKDELIDFLKERGVEQYEWIKPGKFDDGQVFVNRLDLRPDWYDRHLPTFLKKPDYKKGREKYFKGKSQIIDSGYYIDVRNYYRKGEVTQKWFQVYYLNFKKPIQIYPTDKELLENLIEGWKSDIYKLYLED